MRKKILDKLAGAEDVGVEGQLAEEEMLLL